MPTRERTSSLFRTLKSLDDTILDKNEVEIIIVCDNDDYETRKKLEIINSDFPRLNIQKLFRERTIFLNRDYYNFAAHKAVGDFLWVIADDLTFYVQGWDQIIFERLEHFCHHNKDRIICASIRDNTPKPSPHLPKFPCFPMFSKEVFRAIGMLLHPKIPTWGADYLAYRMFFPINRLLFIDDQVYVNHISNHTHQCVSDKTNERIGSIFNQLKNVPAHNIQRIEREEVPILRDHLQKYIGEHSNG